LEEILNVKTIQLRILALASAAAVTAASAARADVVTAWNAAALDAIRVNKTTPPQASRALAILHLSIYDAVNGIVRSHERYLVPSDVPASASVDASASAAAHTALASLFPSSSTDFDQLYAQILSRIPDGPHRRRGLEWGERVAHEILGSRANDHSDAALAPPSGGGPGVWQPTPPAFAPYLLPQWGFVTPFALPSSSFMRPPGPPALNSGRWAADYIEVKSLGAAVNSSRTSRVSSRSSGQTAPALKRLQATGTPSRSASAPIAERLSSTTHASLRC